MNDIFLFFKQKTAYEKRISDWSSDVCSSDLLRIYDQATARSQILAKASKISPLSKARASNLYLLSRLHGPVVTTTLLLNLGRSEERRVGKECVSTLRYRCAPDTLIKKTRKKHNAP